MKKLILVLFSIIIGINVNTQAEDFFVVNDGDTIYYNIISSTSPLTVEVTCKGSWFSDYSNEYSGVVSIPDSVMYGGNYYCVNAIGEGAFTDCNGLTSIIIPNSVTSIGLYSFEDCTGLTSLIIPNSVVSIEAHAFNSCNGLTLITIGNSVVSIGNYAFAHCTGLTSITIPNSVTSINDWTFYGCTGLTSVIISNSVISIGENAFDGCIGLTSIIIPNSVTIINESAFYQCTGLTSVIIGNSVITIGGYAFQGCSGLTNIIIGSSVASIGAYVLDDCNGLTSITCKSINPPIVQDDSFFGVSKTIPIYVPCASISSYQSALYWNEFTNYNAAIQTPTDLIIAGDVDYIEISWQGGENDFEVYRNDSLIADVTQTNYIDNDIVIGQTYCYKVRARDGECASEFSDTICLYVYRLNHISSASYQAKLYPNPTNGKTKLEVEGLNSEADILIYDMIGRIIQSHKIREGERELEIDLSGYAKGVYSIRIVSDRINQTKKLIIE